ncbi:MAG: aldo/keto reductase, partial [Planctomycetota bacterium]
MNPVDLPERCAARLSRAVQVIGWGAFKIGRNEGIKYPTGYDLPSESEAVALVRQIVRMGIRSIDTAPAYGLSEHRVGLALEGLTAQERSAVFLSTKVGERFEEGRSTYDFSRSSVESSVMHSLRSLRREHLDLVWVHSDGSDKQIVADGAAIGALTAFRERGVVGTVGFSAKHVEGARAALADPRIDALMLEYHPSKPEMEPVIADAAKSGRAVFIKKPLASGTLDPARAIPWILRSVGVTSVVVGGLSAERLRANAALAAVSVAASR